MTQDAQNAHKQQQQDRIGWIGLGEMGIEMASNLQKYLVKTQRHPLTVWNRTPEKTTRLADEGAVVATSIASLLEQSNIIFTSLSNDAAVESVYSELLDNARLRSDPVIFIETSTIYPTLASKLATQLATDAPQHRFLQTPIFGRPAAAAAAQLVWVTSGDETTITSLRPYFESMSRAILDLKTEDVSRASVFKLLGNFLVVGSIELLSEGLALGGKNAIGESEVLKLVELLFPSPVWLGYSKLIVDQIQKKEVVVEDKDKKVEGGVSSATHPRGFPVTLGLKDVGHMRQLAKDSGARLPTVEVAYQNLKTMEARGYGDQDWTSMVKALQD